MSDTQTRLGNALSGHYAIERELGHGGMATVYLARDVKHGRRVALKVLHPDLARAVGGARFLREINIAAQLQSPHIVPMLDSGEADGLLYYVMPYVEGDSLRDRLARGGPLPPSEATRLLRDVVEGVAHAHRHGVLHRDIKPDNVMLSDRHALLMDFGVAKAMSDATTVFDLTSIGISLGTPTYMAPEQAAADPSIDHRADIYSLGVLAYEMLSGRPPFTGTPQAVLHAQISRPPESLLSVNPDVPPALAQIVMKCLEKEPANRFQSADELLQAIESLVTPSVTVIGVLETPSLKRKRRLLAGGVVIVALALVAWVGIRVQRDRWVHRTALPELRRLVDAAESDSAFVLANQIERVAPGDTTLAAMWPRFTRRVVLESEPPGARVYRATPGDTSQWYFLRTTPTDSVRLPLRTGLYRYDKPGFQAAYTLAGTPFFVAIPLMILDSAGTGRADVARIPGGMARAFLVGSDRSPEVRIGNYLVDRYEITNSQYKAFVDAGGYTNRTYWEQPFRAEDGRTLSFDEAMTLLVDKTGRPGPSTWEAGTFPGGQGDMPVGGVSWYEAAAYAKFAGKSLPTIYHWANVANIRLARFVVPQSNLEGNRPLPVGTPRGITINGVSDLAGNVREWCVNDAGRGQRFILGGGWSDPRYAFSDAYAQPPMNRLAINGIRLMQYDPADSGVAIASRPIPRAFTDYARENPVSDAVYAGFARFFDYDPRPLDASIEVRDSTPEDWIREKVSFTTAYGERMSAWLYLPRNVSPPFEAVVLFPGSNAIGAAPFAGTLPPVMNFIPPGGRVAVYPIYKATHERSDSLRSDIPDQSIFWRDHVVMWVKDFRRTLDYLATRPDIDTTKIAYFGFSWGGYMGGIIPAVEPRVKASMLYVAGLTMERGRPEVDPVHHLPRIKSPVLMLNGKYDFFFPLETSQKHFFRLLGTPDADRHWIVYEGGHDVPRTELIKESLAWLDKYLGPVR